MVAQAKDHANKKYMRDCSQRRNDKKMYRIATQRSRATKDICLVKYMKGANVLTRVREIEIDGWDTSKDS